MIIGAAAAGAVYVILRNPALRRSAWQVVRRLIAASGSLLVAEASQAWAASGAAQVAPVARATEPTGAGESSARDMIGA